MSTPGGSGEALTGLAPRPAAERITDGDNAALIREAVAAVVETARGDYLELVQARNRFYRRLVRVGGNRELGRMLPTIHVHLVRTQFRRYGSGSQGQREQEFERIAEALFAGNPGTAEAVTRAHVRQTASLILRLPDEVLAREYPIGQCEQLL